MSDVKPPTQGPSSSSPPPPPPVGESTDGNWPRAHGLPSVTDQWGRPLAEWWKRLVAALIDGTVVGIPSFIAVIIAMIVIFAIFTDDYSGELEPAGAVLLTLTYILLSIVPSFAYNAILHGSSRGQTIGKMVMKIQVRDEQTGGQITFGRAALRYVIPGLLGFCTFGLLSLLDGLWPLWDPRRQALHDKLAKTVVIDIGSPI